MSLTVIRKARVVRQYLAYDFEWTPTVWRCRTHGEQGCGCKGKRRDLKLRMLGIYDGEHYRCYADMRSFLAGELTHKNRGKWFYAHAGGLADFLFVLEEILAGTAYKVKASFSGASAIIIHVTRGKNSWHFIDSYWLLRDSLRNIGKWVGIQKGNEEEKEDFYETASFETLREYNALDCIILWKAISFFESVLLDLGGQLKMTQASCGMDLFRRRFLKQDIDTSHEINETARLAYVASRVEVITRECEDAEYFDVNSSFPYAMTYPQPGEFLGSQRGLPDAGLYIADATVEVPDMYLPPLPVRVQGRIFFPTGRWRGWMTDVDIGLLQKVGGRILKVHESLAFAPFTDLRDYSLTLYNLRKQSEGFPKLAYKYLLNSVYGKFAESAFKEGLIINPDSVGEGWRMLFPGVFIVEREIPIPHMHVPISARITAIARRTLYDYMSCSSELHYCDTDGFSTTSAFQSSSELGAIKLEKRIRHGHFITQKVYSLDGVDEHGKELNFIDDQGKEVSKGVKAKGFSRMTLSKFEKISLREEIEYVRMARVKELLRSGQTVPYEMQMTKALRDKVVPKRFFYPDGHSRPWHISELHSQLGG